MRVTGPITSSSEVLLLDRSTSERQLIRLGTLKERAAEEGKGLVKVFRTGQKNAGKPTFQLMTTADLEVAVRKARLQNRNRVRRRAQDWAHNGAAHNLCRLKCLSTVYA